VNNKTDREKVEILFKELGIGIMFDSNMEANPADSGDNIWLNVDEEKITGYGGFGAIFCFDSEGAFEGVQIAE